MSYHNGKTTQNDDMGMGKDDVCFHCHKTFRFSPYGGEPRIWWMGSDETGKAVNLKFHIACATHFLLRFSRDLYESDMKRNQD